MVEDKLIAKSDYPFAFPHPFFLKNNPMRNILPNTLLFAIVTLLSPKAGRTQIVNHIILDHNNVSCILTDEGGFFTDVSSTNAAYQVPKSDSVSSIFAGSFFVGAQDPMGQIYFSGRKYSLGGSESSFHSGPIADPFYYNTSTYSQLYQNALWKVSKAAIDSHQVHFQTAGYQIPNAILKWPGNGVVPMGVAAQLAPYIDLNQNGIYEPQLGEYPDIRGDEAVYIIMNDESYLPDGNQLRIELHAMFYQFSTGNYLNNTTFMNVQVFNRSNINYANYHQGIYIDYDIGNFSDDRLGCSPDKNMLFAYNGDDFDENDGGTMGYGPNPPCQALVSLSHPLKSGAAFTTGQDYFANDAALWLLMNSQWTDTTLWINPLTNQVTDFILPDNPNDPNGWSEEALGLPSGDRRGMITIYEQTFRPGAKICSDYAFIYSRVGSRLQNVQDVWNIATSLQALYNSSEQFVCQTSSVGIFSEMKTPEKLLSIYPNPANAIITIDSKFQTPYEIEIYNSMGQLVLQKNMQGLSNETISLEGLSTGCYLIKASNGQEVISEKLVVE